MKKGDEIFLHYNSHSNCVLFSEYGFVVPRGGGGEVRVDDLVERLFVEDWKRELLESRGYWR